MMPTEPVTFRTYVIFDNRCPAPRRKDEPMETPTPVFYFGMPNAIRYGFPPPGALTFDPMDDAAFTGYTMAPEALAELLRRRPDPAKAQAELERLRAQLDRADRAGVAWEAHDKTLGVALNAARATIDALRLEVATLHALLKNPTHLRAALARIDAKAARIAELESELATLKANE